ncbi:hypothetical protein V2J09_005566 [Rumex salicifolius]
MEESSKDPNNNPQKEEELSHEITITTTTTTTTTKAAPPESGGKRKRVVGGGVKKQAAGTAGRRRTGKKDRHSKIYTAQGPRDRRMRLSLQIARKFFDLQDMLGFDKASKTIEWLFSKSKAAIKDLTSSLPPHQRKGSLVITHNNKVNLEDFGQVNEAPKMTKISTKPGYSNPVARESREKARARARQRTIEKKKQKELISEINPNHNSNTNINDNNNNNNNNVSKFGSTSTPETVDQEEFNSTTLEAMDLSSQPQQSPIENQMSSSVSIIEKLLGSDSSASSSSIYDECSYLGFNGNWATESLRMYPSHGALINGVDELQLIVQQQNPNSLSSAASSGMQFQSP